MHARGSRGGFTFIEMAIVMVILIATGALIYRVAEALTISYRTGETRIQVYENLRKGMAACVKELRQARKVSLMAKDDGSVEPPTGDKIYFQVPQDLDGNGNVLNDATGIVEYSRTITLRRDATRGYLLREQDRNYNGMIEPMVPGEVMILAINVDEVKFDVDMFTDPENPTIEVTIRTKRKLDKNYIKAELTQKIFPRN